VPVAVLIFHLSRTIEWTSVKFGIGGIYQKLGGSCNSGSCYSHITLCIKYKNGFN
jgi:hypothetical protein